MATRTRRARWPPKLDADMVGEVFGRPGRRPLREVFRCADDGHVHRPRHPYGDHVAAARSRGPTPASNPCARCRRVRRVPRPRGEHPGRWTGRVSKQVRSRQRRHRVAWIRRCPGAVPPSFKVSSRAGDFEKRAARSGPSSAEARHRSATALRSAVQQTAPRGLPLVAGIRVAEGEGGRRDGCRRRS